MRYFLLLLAIPFLYSDTNSEEDIEVPNFNFTKHAYDAQDKSFEYTAVTGKMPIIREGINHADIFFIAYAIEGEENRPVTFCFPGGPGGAETFSAIGGFGPRRIMTAGEGRTILPPYKFIDNPETLLPFTDLVFIDPPDCGFSESTEDANLASLYSVEGDIYCLGEAVHAFITHFQRWNSPLYLKGSSYGTLRCCGLASELRRYGLNLHGIILDGCAFEYSTIQSERDQVLSDSLSIPTYAATAWYHKRLWPERSLDEVIDYARRFAFEEYLPVMHQPSRLSTFEKSHFHKRLAEIIGLPKEIVSRYDGRINESIYTSEFFFPERKVLGGLDTRYSGDVASINPDYAEDPSYKDGRGFLPAFMYYLQKELETSYPFTQYKSFSPRILNNWSFETYDSIISSPNLLQRLRRVMIANPLMKVFVGLGLYDCRTPFGAAEYAFDHLDLAPSYRNNLQFEYYEAGHGLLYDYSSMTKMRKDLSKFYAPQTLQTSSPEGSK